MSLTYRYSFYFITDILMRFKVLSINTFFATYKVNDVNPQQWFTHILENIKDTRMSKLAFLLPHKAQL